MQVSYRNKVLDVKPWSQSHALVAWRLTGLKSFQDDSHSTLLLYRILQPEDKYKQNLSEVKCCIQIGGCWADVDVVAMVCVLTRDAGNTMYTLIGKTRFA